MYLRKLENFSLHIMCYGQPFIFIFTVTLRKKVYKIISPVSDGRYLKSAAKIEIWKKRTYCLHIQLNHDGDK